ncbi:hypothetical protein [Kineosporia babensis]|uniref:Uncharacterized protein n=1 Tax=Kineosporia babensis TaxID=499548 RepID=A0A9X1N994_9ACTN|nr:hypothetical protein [Kineosporia babensis]MCD5310892.1 hypothetical protein [Kineosporia babensis]
MTRPLDQADVDAVLVQEMGRGHWDALPDVGKDFVRETTLGTLNAAVAIGWTPPACDEARFFWRTRSNSYTSNEWQTAAEQAATFTEAFPETVVEIVDERTLLVNKRGGTEKTVIEGWEEF